MKIVTASDLHLDHYMMDENFGLTEKQLKNGYRADVLILAGDIFESAMIYSDRLLHVFGEFADHYKDVIYIMGNHEHYDGDFDMTAGRIRNFLKVFPNIHFLDNNARTIGDVRFFGGTMWTDMNRDNPMTHLAVSEGMNDFGRLIDNSRVMVSYRAIIEDGKYVFKQRPSKFSTKDAYNEHMHFLNALLLDLEKHAEEKYVVVSHHLPTYSMINPMYGSSTINAGYASNLDELFYTHENIKVWVHGHTHGRTRMMLNETEIILNARGYRSENMYSMSRQNYEFAEKEL